MFKLFLALISLGLIAQINCESVPAFIFGDKTPTFLPTLQHVSGDEFVALVKSQADKDTLTVVFVENKLSVEDLSQCKLNTKTCFENLRKTDKTYLSSVENPVDSLINAFDDKNKKSITVNGDNDLIEATVAGEKILFVYLDDVENSEDFSKHDELITKLLQQLQSKYGEVLAIYTGIHPSFEYPLRRHVREAEAEAEAANEEVKPAPAPVESTAAPPKQHPRQQEDEPIIPTHVFTNIPNVLIALKSFSIANKKPTRGDPTVVLANQFTLTIENSTENGLVAILTGSGHKISMETSLSAGTWSINFRYNDNDEKVERYHSRSSAVGYGESWSFGCGDLYIESFDHEIILSGFQFQPFFTPLMHENKFVGRVSDCVGYFSPGIWGALFVIIILLSIMSYGLTMMMDIRTMDKFDDPKGKTITVNAGD